MVMKTLLTEVKTTIEQRQGERTSTWWLDSRGRAGHASTSWRRHSSYATPSVFGGLGLKIAGDRFVVFRPKNLREDVRSARGVIRGLASRQSGFMKGPWPSDAWNPFWTILPLWLSGSRQIPRGSLGMCNNPINKESGCPRQLSLSPKSISLG